MWINSNRLTREKMIKWRDADVFGREKYRGWIKILEIKWENNVNAFIIRK